MKINPLALFTGLALATLGALIVVEKDKWTAQPLTVAKTEMPAAEPPKPVDTAKSDAPAVETPKTNAQAPAADAPSFDTVRVEANGNTIIAGRAEPGSEVTIKYNGVTVGAGTTNADGAFVVTPEKPLPTGPGALSIEMKGKTTTVASADSVAVDVKGSDQTPMVAVLKPDQPTTLIQVPTETKPVLPPMKTVNIDTVDYDEAGNMVFSGRGPAGSKVQLYVDNNAFAAGDVGEKGTWSILGNAPLAIGAHELRADEITKDGSVTSRVAMPFYREDPKKVATITPVATPEPTVAAAAPAAPAVKVTMIDKTKDASVVLAPAATSTTSTTVTTTVETAEAPAPAAVAVPTPAVETPKVATAEPSKVEAPAPAVAAAPAAEPPKAEQAAPAVAAAAPAAEASVPAAGTPVASRIVIQPGNNLWKLSRKIYGKGTMYTVIYEANKDQIRKPGLIYPGQIFSTPEAAIVK